jgi:hypothetical protein
VIREAWCAKGDEVDVRRPGREGASPLSFNHQRSISLSMPVRSPSSHRLVTVGDAHRHLFLQAYHSTFNELTDVRVVGNTSVLPIKSRFRGPAPLGSFPAPLCPWPSFPLPH